MKNIFALLFTVCVMLSVFSVKADEKPPFPAVSNVVHKAQLTTAVKAEMKIDNIVSTVVPIFNWHFWGYDIISPYVKAAPINPGVTFTKVVLNPPNRS